MLDFCSMLSSISAELLNTCEGLFSIKCFPNDGSAQSTRNIEVLIVLLSQPYYMNSCHVFYFRINEYFIVRDKIHTEMNRICNAAEEKPRDLLFSKLSELLCAWRISAV